MRSNLSFVLFVFCALLAGLGAGPAYSQDSESAPDSSQTKLDLNTATKKQLQKVPGLDANKAAAIVNGRNIGPYTNVSDLLYVIDDEGEFIFEFDTASVEELKKYVEVSLRQARKMRETQCLQEQTQIKN